MNNEDRLQELTKKIISNQATIAKLNKDNYETEILISQLHAKLEHNDILIHNLAEANEDFKRQIQELEKG